MELENTHSNFKLNTMMNTRLLIFAFYFTRPFPISNTNENEGWFVIDYPLKSLEKFGYAKNV